LDYDPKSQDMYLMVGTPLIAIVNNRSLDIVNNENYEVKAINKDTVTVVNELHSLDIQTSKVASLFYPAYCITTHCSPGQNFDHEFTIYEWRKFSEKMKYTAITRATKLCYVNIFP